MKLHVGTSGYSYKEWKGSFYPRDLAAGDMLGHYATKLPSVEINNTFYRLPRASVLQSWAQQVPEDFRFAIKASRRITHFKRLKEAQDETTYLLETLHTLGEKLGVVLFQLPPNLKKDLDRLATFIGTLDPDTNAVFEFRHASWMGDDVCELLKQRRCGLCVADVDDEPEPELRPTAPFGYVRLRRSEYAPDDLGRWAARIGQQPWEEAYVFFKHEGEGAGPALARQFLACAGRATGTS